MRLIVDNTSERYSFLTVNNKLGLDKRFRKNLDEFIVLTQLGQHDKEKQNTAEPIYTGKSYDIEENEAYNKAIDLLTHNGSAKQTTGSCGGLTYGRAGS